MEAMSIHGSTIIPGLRYKDAHAAIDWLERVLGFTRQAIYEGPNGTVAHAQLTYGGGMLMLGSASNGGASANFWAELDETGGRETAALYLVVTDAECLTLYDRVKADGREIVQELTSPPHGGKSFGCRDLEGHIWWIGSYDPWAQHSAPAAEGTA
ncbi:MAG TPA: VOC family protein [Acidobacteriaceae bacterium]|jgi:uncharacterized glyoxalase superfamily protein PhnB|nr:VOC family protein [Acidobacteriaceae bacterium]